MRVVLVYRGRYHVRQALDLEVLAPVMRGAGHDVRLVYDADVFGVTDNVVRMPWLAGMLSSPVRRVTEILAAAPDVVVFSVLPATYAWAREAARLLRSRGDVRVVFMGLHPALVPERVMADSFVDFAIQGEAEGVINELLRAIAGRGPVTGVGNLWYRRDKEARFTFRAGLADLDALPPPDKDLFRPYVSQGYGYVAMVSRGCPYHCSFCEEPLGKALYGSGYFRRKRVATVIRELVAAKQRYGFREVIFKDSYLSGDQTWLRELMGEYREKVGVPFKCFCTILAFDDETARLLKEGGCYNVEFGLQTWNERMRREVLARNETNEDALRAFAACARHRLRYDVDHMLDLPGESEADHAEGALRYRGLRGLNRVKVHRLVYLPGAAIVDYALERKAVPRDMPDRLAQGMSSDFFNQGTGSVKADALVAGYGVLYRLLPLLPGWCVRRLARGGRARWLRFIPSCLVAAAQGVIALRGGDLRFAAYVRLYPRKVWHAVADAMRRRRA